MPCPLFFRPNNPTDRFKNALRQLTQGAFSLCDMPKKSRRKMALYVRIGSDFVAGKQP